MQFVSLHRERDAVFFGSLDSEARTKDFMIEPGKYPAMVHYAENMGVPGSDLVDHYAVELGVYQGNWADAARRYRRWAVRRKGTGAGRLSAPGDVPEALKNAGIWLAEGWYRHPKPGQAFPPRACRSKHGPHVEWNTTSNAPYLELQKRAGIPLALRWYHWNRAKFNNLFPHFLPAKDGFRERVRELVDAGWLVMPYINAVNIDMNIPDFDRFRPHAIADNTGSHSVGFFGNDAGRLVPMCPSRNLWHETISGLVNSLVEQYGGNAAYLGQVSAAGSALRFDRRPGHPLGGGRWWADGCRERLRKMRNNALRSGRRGSITSESTDEVFHDVLGANLTTAPATGQDIPLLQIVYSGFTLFFGSPCDFNRSGRFFRSAQGRALMNGIQNGWTDINAFGREHAEKGDYLLECGRYRVAAGKFVTYGDLVRPVEPAAPAPRFVEQGPADPFGQGTPAARDSLPCAEARLWRSEDGHAAVILVNYDDQPAPFPFRVRLPAAGLKGERFALSDAGPGKASRIGSSSAILERTERLAAREIKILEIAPER